MLLTSSPGTAADKPPARSLAELDEAFAAAARNLARRATEAGDESLAAMISDWPLPAAGEHQLVVQIPSRIEKPATVDTPDEEMIWDDFVAARRTRARSFCVSCSACAARCRRRPFRRARGRSFPRMDMW
jgi:hypothetical protein